MNEKQCKECLGTGNIKHTYSRGLLIGNYLGTCDYCGGTGSRLVKSKTKLDRNNNKQ